MISELTRLTVAVSSAGAEAAMADACDLLGTGCREREDAGRVLLDFWLEPARAPTPEALRAALATLGHPVEVSGAAERSDWQGALRAFHRPVTVAGRLRVRPPWEPTHPALLDVAIDPGMAFGTGQHATTLGCLELLVGLAPPGGPAPGPLLDIGAGSGVLAIAARRLGYDPVWALDSDPLAVAATLANARRNGVGLRVARRAIGRDALPAAPTVLANLTATVLGALAGALPAPAPRALVASGLRPDEAAPVAAVFARHGLAERERVEREGWATLLLVAG